MAFYNLLMLWGFAGAVGVPVVAHLLSRRKFDVVDWGAMQFLQADKQMRRRFLLEELLLLLIRIALGLLVVTMLSRPWVSGGWLGDLLSAPRRDIAIVIDGSYSMGWEGGGERPFDKARTWARGFISSRGAGDTITLLDARDQTRLVTPSPTSDTASVQRALGELPPPSGTSDLTAAMTSAMRALTAGTNPVRDVIVLTDGQARGWAPDDIGRWDIIDDLQDHQQVKPHLWVVDVTAGMEGDRANFSLEKLTPSRELAVAGLPVRFKTRIAYTGGNAAVQRKVYFEVDGQRLAESTVQTPNLAPGSAFNIEFDHVFTTQGSHLVSAVLDADSLPGDNRSDAALTVAAAVPVLLVDGAKHLDPTRSESYFARAALSAADNQSPLIRAQTITPDQLNKAALRDIPVCILMNVARLTPAQSTAIETYVAAGGGLIVAPGDQVDAAHYNKTFFGRGDRLLPASLGKIELDDSKPPSAGVRVLDSSLSLPFLAQLRREFNGGFTEARFSRWWQLTPAPLQVAEDELDPADQRAEATAPTVAARLTNNSPFLVLRGYGRGRVALLAGPLDSDWSTLPARPDYVAFLHECIFHAAGGAAPARNVLVGDTLILPVPAGTQSSDFVFMGPGKTELEPALVGDSDQPSLRLDQTQVAGVYTLERKVKRAGQSPEHFVVNFDRTESDLTALTDEQRNRLAGESRLKFIKTPQDLKSVKVEGAPPVELWRWFAAAVLAFLVFEIVVTSILMRRNPLPAAQEEPPEEPVVVG